MDKKMIQRYGEDILCYRIRTARHKKRTQYEDFDKLLIQIDKEHSALFRKKHSLGWEPLIPPVQKGWKRFFVLRADMAQSKYAGFYENISKKINTYDWSHRKDFKVKRRRFGRKVYVIKPQQLLEPYDCYFEKLDLSDDERRLFQPVLFYHKHSAKPTVKFVFREPWRFVLRVEPNMIDKIRIRDNELESRLRQINDYLDRNAYDRRLSKLLHGNRRWGYVRAFEKYNEKNPLKNKPLHQILAELKDEMI